MSLKLHYRLWVAGGNLKQLHLHSTHEEGEEEEGEEGEEGPLGG